MFRDQQDYRAVAFRSKSVDAIDDLFQFLPRETLKAVDAVPSESNRFKGLHCYYYSSHIYSRSFSNSELEPMYTKRIRGHTYYRYNLYLINVNRRQKNIFLIAVPFLGMATEIYSRIIHAARGHSFKYQIPLLDTILTSISKGRHLQGSLSIKRISYGVRGDSNIDSLSLKGEDVIHSVTSKSIASTSAKHGIEIPPESLRLCYLEGTHRMTIDLDKYGHYRFRIASKAHNVPSLEPIINYLLQEGCLDEKNTFPPLRSLVGNVEEEE